MPARWYVPPGEKRPAHATSPVLCRMTETGGPPGAVPGGLCIGGPMEAAETGWLRHSAGHWYNLQGASPLQMIRLDPHPRLVEWRTVAGALPDHLWRVPVLVTPEYDEADSTKIISFKSGLDRVWTGSGWDLPDRIVDLRRRLLWTFQEVAGERLTLSSAEAVAMALDLLAEGQDFDREEIIGAGWVSEVLVVRALCAGSDRDIG